MQCIAMTMTVTLSLTRGLKTELTVHLLGKAIVQRMCAYPVVNLCLQGPAPRSTGIDKEVT